MKRVGITGQEGFVGTHLYNTLDLHKEHYTRIPYDISYFHDENKLDSFISKCDVIVHLAAKNRHSNAEVIYNTNIDLVKKIVDSLKRTGSKAHIVFSSSSQEQYDNAYGNSKREGRNMLSEWAKSAGAPFTGLIIPNVFGPFGLPNYNSFIATFCYRLTHGETPHIDNDNEVSLIYVGELVNEIIRQIEIGNTNETYVVPHTSVIKVSDVLGKLNYYRETYFEKGEIPLLENSFDLNLFNTFRSYIDISQHFPSKLKINSDNRGTFVEIVRLEIGGQCSFSTTLPDVTRGNHYHTRKIERFAVIKGNALIQLRKIGTSEVLNFYLDGNLPAYVDMPIWYTHNIKNIGKEYLYTIFWINEPYNPQDADTYFEEV